MDNTKYLEEMQKFNTKTLNVNTQCRTAKALEIIAEEMIKLNENINKVTDDEKSTIAVTVYKEGK